MSLVPTKGARCDRTHAIKKGPPSGDARKDWGIPVVNLVCWDHADALYQFGVRLRSALLKPKSDARRVFFDTRKPTRPICGSCKSRGKARLGGLAKA